MLGCMPTGKKGKITRPQPTYCNKRGWDKKSWGNEITRPDVILANNAAKELTTSCCTRPDLGLKGHVGIEIKTRTRKLESMQKRLLQPKPLPMEEVPRIGDDEKHRMALAVTNKYVNEYKGSSPCQRRR